MPSVSQIPPPRLNLPSARLSLRQGAKGVEVHDVYRSKWVLLTPEEWVRQHFVHYLVEYLGYPAGMVANEMGINLNSTSRRCDTVVFSLSLAPLMIVEYKAPSVRIDQKVLDQIVSYNTVLRVPYLVVSNGLHHYCFKAEGLAGRYVPLSFVPRYGDM